MTTPLWAIARQGKIKLLEQAEIPGGTRILVTVLAKDESKQAKYRSYAVWDNTEDDVYAQLLEK